MHKSPAQPVEGVFMLKVPFPTGFVSPGDDSGTLCYLIEDTDGWIMVDTGYNDDAAFGAWCEQLSATGIAPRSIRRLLITHFHPDHSGLAARVRELSGADVFIHRDDWTIIDPIVDSSHEWHQDDMMLWLESLGAPSSETESFQTMAAFGRTLFPSNLKPECVVEEARSHLNEAGTLLTILTPGHSPGHLCLYDSARKVLFAGDHVLPGITPHISPSHLASHNQLGQYLDALRAVRDLDVDLVLPAHEGPFTELSQRVDQILDHHKQRLAETAEALSSQPMTPWDVATRVKWSVGLWEHMNAADRILAVRETLAHLQLLEIQGHVANCETGSVKAYELTK